MTINEVATPPGIVQDFLKSEVRLVGVFYVDFFCIREKFVGGARSEDFCTKSECEAGLLAGEKTQYERGYENGRERPASEDLLRRITSWRLSGK